MNPTIAPDMLLGFLEVVLRAAETGVYPALFEARDELQSKYVNLKSSIETGDAVTQNSTAATQLLSTPCIAKEVFSVAIEHSLRIARSTIDKIRASSDENEPPPESSKRFIRESLAPFILRIARDADVSNELIQRLERLTHSE